MLIIDASHRPTSIVTLVLTRSEALELIEKVAYLLRRPDYHHDHLRDEHSSLDILIPEARLLPTYHESLRPLVAEFLAEHRSAET